MQMYTKKAQGPDYILPNWTVHDLHSRPSHCYINSSLPEGYLPEVWRSATIIPVHTKPRPQDITKDLRPISLTPVLSKINK